MTKAALVLLMIGCSHAPEARVKPPAAPATPAQAADQSLPPAAGLPRTIPRDPRYYAPREAPDPLACRDDKDCISDTIVDAKAGCCVVESDPMPQTWAWHAWVTEHRMSPSCDDAKCQPVAVPDNLPRACLLEARCQAGRCDTRCETGDTGVK